MPSPQPWFLSKAFVVLLLGAIFNGLRIAGVISPETDTNTLVNSIVLVLGMFFRWTADQPLSLTAEPQARKLRAASKRGAIASLLHD